jgi:adenosine deaminase
MIGVGVIALGIREEPERMLRTIILVFIIAGAVGGCAPAVRTAGPASAAQYYGEIREQPALLEAFLRRMPKGGDLHNHLSGAIYAESLIGWAVADGLCVERVTVTLRPPPCAPAKGVPALADTLSEPNFYAMLIRAFSMRDFVPGAESGHDHFFASFGKFGAATAHRLGDMLAEAATRAAADRVDYLELMESPGMGAARQLGLKHGWRDDLDALRAELMQDGMAEIVAAARRDIDAGEARMRTLLGCAAAAPPPACRITIRYLAQVIRTFPPAQVFAQAVLAFELARGDQRFVGLNLVAPEDDPVTLRDYDSQMRILGFLSTRFPMVKLTLHAGELTTGLVPPEHLRSHIRGAVEIAGARRIGHGVDIMYEDDPLALLTEMAQRRILVEINLTSNDVILGVSGRAHPFETYRRFGVPVALSTDDEGVSRIDLTHEYLRAALAYDLSYDDLKTLARNSLEYAFLPGDSLWRSGGPFVPADACAATPLGAVDPAPSCRAVLAASERARQQWRLEAEFADFETLRWTPP